MMKSSRVAVFFISVDKGYSTVLHCTSITARKSQERNNVNAVNVFAFIIRYFGHFVTYNRRPRLVRDP